MTVFQTAAIILTLAAFASYVNHRIVRLPATIGLMVISLAGTSALVALGHMGIERVEIAARFVTGIDFGEVVLHAMLAFLLFAGALHVDLEDLRDSRVTIGVLATAGVVLATFLIAGLFHATTLLLGLTVPFVYCLLFGALISPTDPIAVLGIVRKVGAPKHLETKIAGESLFNDGIGVVVFITILGVAIRGGDPRIGPVILFLLREVVGGVALGIALGWITYRLLKPVDAYQVEILVTLAVVAGGYSLAEALHLSAPITVVVAGLLVGNHGRSFAMSDKTRERLDAFWELVDEVMNAVLFVLIGMELIVLQFSGPFLAVGILSIPAVLIGRFVSVGIPVGLLRRSRGLGRGTVRILTWAGLRGGISIALALSLPPGKNRDLILVATYCVVVFSVLVQGLTIGRLMEFLARPQGGPGQEER